ncbi:MAG: DnaJ domain-containing protein [Candidatus Rokubacteria bacterium]|nr:DnaJ domain-containing protein [Candidatus Rokubacteria bacterium]
MRKRDYYDVLGVPRHATVQAIRQAYRRLARQCSPDINVWDERAGDVFAEITEAYRLLADPGARAVYDRLGHRAFEPEADAGPESEPRGEDVHYPIEIEFEEALRGVTAVVELTRQEPCARCRGTGGADGCRATRCPDCAGRPLRIVSPGGAPTAIRCTGCGGAGWRLPEPCPECGGRGTVPGRARVLVGIPAGVDTGSQTRVRGEGHASRSPGTPGDLVVITRVRPHPLFTRKGDNLYCEVPITIPEAALGARIEVPTPDGPAVITVPAGTQSGQVFRLRGKGCPRLDRDGRGDLFVEARVTIPRNADSTLEEVLRALQRLLPEDPRAALWARGRR